MGGEQETNHTQILNAWIQALAIIGVVGLAAFDVTQPGEAVPWQVYVVVLALVVGASDLVRHLWPGSKPPNT